MPYQVGMELLAESLTWLARDFVVPSAATVLVRNNGGARRSAACCVSCPGHRQRRGNRYCHRHSQQPATRHPVGGSTLQQRSRASKSASSSGGRSGKRRFRQERAPLDSALL